MDVIHVFDNVYMGEIEPRESIFQVLRDDAPMIVDSVGDVHVFVLPGNTV
jgi:hypothetical protein